MYDDYIERYGGRIVGQFVEDVRLINGELVDIKYYEITKKEVVATIAQKAAHRLYNKNVPTLLR
jgi:hypothetical protein